MASINENKPSVNNSSVEKLVFKTFPQLSHILARIIEERISSFGLLAPKSDITTMLINRFSSSVPRYVIAFLIVSIEILLVKYAELINLKSLNDIETSFLLDEAVA